MNRSVLLVATAGALALALAPADAKPKPSKAKTAPASTPPMTIPAPIVPDAAPDGMMTPKEVRLRPTTPIEAEANAIWSTRAALNIAALQCQFSPFLATVRNYNDFLRQHADELDRARATMITHFKRYDATQAQNSFDRYTTQTYNSYSTLDAQYAFCEAAANAGRIVLTVRKGDLGRTATILRDRIRAALIPVSARSLLRPVTLDPVAVPAL